MKNFIRHALNFQGIFLIGITAVLFSFASKPGADHYQVYLDQSLVADQYVHNQKVAPAIFIDGQSKLTVSYSHCGKIGTARSIIIKNDREKVLKEWTFADVAAGADDKMSCAVKDIQAFKTGSGSPLKLVYKSSEIPDGRLLVSIRVGKENKTASN